MSERIRDALDMGGAMIIGGAVIGVMMTLAFGIPIGLFWLACRLASGGC
jgi:hypothetical protein